MKKKLMTLFVSTFFVSGLCAQMTVHGIMVNCGDAKIGRSSVAPTDLIIPAIYPDAATASAGFINNIATGGKKLDVTGKLVLHSVSWDIKHSNNAKGIDGILLSNPNATSVATTVANAQVVKHFKSAGYYLISLPFDVPENGITNSRNATFHQWGTSAENNPSYWIQYYDTEKRAKYGLIGANGTSPSTGWVGFGSDESTETTGKVNGVSPALKGGQLYQIYINQSGDYTFTSQAGATAGMFGLGDNHSRTTSSLAYQTTGNAGYHPGHPERENYNYGWHAIGTMQTTPFHLNNQSASNISGFITDGSGGMTINNVYLYLVTHKDGAGNVEAGKWVAKKIGGGSGIDDDISIAPYTGMMVQVSQTSTVAFAGAGRSKNPAGTHFRSATTIPYLNLQLSDATDRANLDELSVILKPGSSNEFMSGEDGLKFFGGTLPEFSLMIPNVTGSVAVTNDYRATWVDNEEIPISLWIKADGNYSMQLTDIQGFDTPVYLVDKYLETITELTAEANYDFQASATDEPLNDRFALRAGATTGLPSSVFNKVLIYAAEGRVYIENLTIGDKVAIYNLTGQLVETLRATSPDTSVALPAKGVYVVKVTGSESVVSKIINK